MNKQICAMACGLLVFSLATVRADADGERRSAPVQNKTYQETCSVCHMVYFPGMLPAQSWEKILTNMKTHNGEEVALDAKIQAEILAYLKKNAADQSGSGLSGRIMRSLKDATPTRITEVPMIKRKHSELSGAIFQRKEIGSHSNCIACHAKAGQGEFSEDTVRSPGGGARKHEGAREREKD